MELTQNYINKLLNYDEDAINEICASFGYDNNIRHLLYIIIPAFITKYGLINEPTIIDCFRNIKIYIKEHEKNITATFSRKLVLENNEYKTNKIVTINPFNESSISLILDNLIHEFNHAINSYNNEIKVDKDYIKVRTGLTYINYNKNDLSYVSQDNETILEEIINTSQTEDVLNIIKSFGDFEIENQEYANTIYTVCHEIGDKKYISDAYSFQKEICKDLINNSTFKNSVNKLRIKGNLDELSKLFDEMVGKAGSFKKLNKLLAEIQSLMIKYESSKILKNKYLNKIKELVNEVTNIIKEYNINCIFR